MPLLDEEGVANLVREAKAPSFTFKCSYCARFVVKDYCRSCDVYYFIHAPNCTWLYGESHDGHRLTIVPFVEA